MDCVWGILFLLLAAVIVVLDRRVANLEDRPPRIIERWFNKDD